MRTEGLTVPGKKYMQALHSVAAWSCWFEVTPFPDDCYEFRFKAGEGHIGRLVNELSQPEIDSADYKTAADLPADFIVMRGDYTRLKRYSRNDPDDWDLSIWRDGDWEYDDSVGDTTALKCFRDSDYVAVMLKAGGSSE